MKLAHLKWFEDPTQVVLQSVTGAAWLVPVLIVLIGLIALIFIDQKSKKITHKLARKLAFLRPYVPTVIRITIGLSLIIYAIGGSFFAPNVPTNMWILLGLEFSVGLLLVLGLFTQFSAIALVVIYLLSTRVEPLGGLLEHLEYIGAAVYLMLVGSGALALDNRYKINYQLLRQYKERALSIFCFATGLSLGVLAFTEKLFNLQLAEKFLGQHHWNLAAPMGLSDYWFIIIAGSIELLLGLAIALRIADRLVVSILALTMVATTIALGPTEVSGHLFALGLAFAIWVGDEKLTIKKHKIH